MAPSIAEKKNNSLSLWGNEKTMNLNNLILTNILSSHYFKVNLYQLKTYHEVIDEIYYQVNHLEPWEKGSRKTSGQTGMCGGVRGVGAGGIVSTAFCILYKLFTLKLTRKQVVGLINHTDSPYIRALGFMYIRYTQPPVDLWDWYENYLTDPEELDVKAGGGQTMTIGEMLRHFLSKLEWFSTLFPRIPVPIQKDLERKLAEWRAQPKNKALTTTHESLEWDEGTEQPENASEVDNSLISNHSLQDIKTKLNENAVDEYKEVASLEELLQEKQKKEKHSVSSKSHHHHSHEHDKNYSHHRHRNSVKNKVKSSHDGDGHRRKHKERSECSRSFDRYRNSERDRSIERGKHRSHGSSKSKIRRKEIDDLEGHRNSKIKLCSPEGKSNKKHSHRHNHNYEKRHEREFHRSYDRH